MKPLYLLGTGLRVALDAGPSLVVVSPQQAPRQFPLARVSRITCEAQVDFDTPALLACARAGVVVTFLDAAGDVCACLYGYAGRRTRLAARLRGFVDRPDWRERLQQWERACDGQARRELLVRLGYAGDACPPQQLRAALAGRLEALLTPALAAYVTRRVQAWLETIAASALVRAGVTAQEAVWLEDTLGLRALLARVLWWWLYLPLAEALEELGDPPIAHLEPAWLAASCERQARTLGRRTQVLLGRLAAYLTGLGP